MYQAFSNPRLFVIAYLALVLPNLGLVDPAAVEQGLFLSSFNMSSVLYVLSMVGILGICFIRGFIIGKKWLLLIPAVAFFFDLTPSLAAISIVPYLYHFLAIILGTAHPLATVIPTDT